LVEALDNSTIFSIAILAGQLDEADLFELIDVVADVLVVDTKFGCKFFD
jgi:hypothetical protein